MSKSAQEEAEGFISDIHAGEVDKDSYSWPSIDYDDVTTESCRTIFQLLKENSNVRDYADITETPRRQRVARHLNSVIAEREYLPKKRAFDAQICDAALKRDLVPVFDFLRAARRNPGEEFIFPTPAARILSSVVALRVALDKVEDLVMASTDVDATAPDSELGDPNITLVEDQER
ncbi:hypothetical protein MVEN_01463000 [Mycena venus]|uniref:Uncharacterized protein n=1 Tax=Mycena venus TaxID=2733690 RepID=A0A8H6XVK9_9AGAR|nr:hypothetical protein MVEN_01463000 [Mycena venus]